mmetsp:Transcript_28683/g.39623  ORF Transcript_28683/g.39623 Transcript_28683/m.39623 type:complete len:253 (+) Transcript_28683:192-950(+)
MYFHSPFVKASTTLFYFSIILPEVLTSRNMLFIRDRQREFSVMLTPFQNNIENIQRPVGKPSNLIPDFWSKNAKENKANDDAFEGSPGDRAGRALLALVERRTPEHSPHSRLAVARLGREAALLRAEGVRHQSSLWALRRSASASSNRPPRHTRRRISHLQGLLRDSTSTLSSVNSQLKTADLQRREINQRRARAAMRRPPTFDLLASAPPRALPPLLLTSVAPQTAALSLPPFLAPPPPLRGIWWTNEGFN